MVISGNKKVPQKVPQNFGNEDKVPLYLLRQFVYGNKYTMKIKQTILFAINNVDSRRRISEKMGIGDQMLSIHIRRNLVNGRLTKMDALKAISEETGTAIEDICEEVAESASA